MKAPQMILAHIKTSFRETFAGRASEWALATVLFLWGIILLSNPNIFSTTPNLRPLSLSVSQPVWAMLCVTAGLARLSILTINGAWRRSPHARALSAFLSCFFWYQITVGLLGSPALSTGLAVYPVLLLLDAFNVIRAMGEAGRVDRRHKPRTADGLGIDA